jgi:sorbitol-6-phosphate 2-dehydrogenase
MLLGREGKYPIVRFHGQSTDKPDSCINISITEDCTQEQIIEMTSIAIGQNTQSIEAVNIEDLGLFTVASHPTELTGRVAGKIILVTGAAQGIGQEIAQNLLAQGAIVVIADINEDILTKTSEKLGQKYDAERVMPLKIDVTESNSVKEAVDKIVMNCGGLDILISNAGVLKAGSVKTQTEKDFDFTTAVNYKGYFLCTQAVAPILAVQHKANNEYLSDIIQINSKSGLQGSNRNGAYAGSKFGAVGLTQSFALELVSDGIKVNSICPGNFFDGPLWSDPKNGLLIQYLNSGKVPGAKTIEDVRRAYEEKVPMGRGCATADILTAIYYLIEQKYETGQAIPVTGGQVMLH